MRIIPILIHAFTLVASVNSYSFKKSLSDVSSLSQKATIAKTTSLAPTSMSVVREPIRMPSQTPMVPWKPPGADVAQFVDINAAMYRDRTIMISQFIDEQYANQLISIILYLRKESPRDPISIYLNVPGAMLRPALALYDLIQQTKDMCEVETLNLGLCAGMAAILCSAGTKGKRSAMPNSRFLLSRTGMDKPFQGQATDIALEVRNVKKMNDRMEAELSKLTGQKVEKIHQDLKRDMYLVAEEAVQYGLIDQVILPARRRRAEMRQEADLGAFEGDDTGKYQGQNNEGGWGSRQSRAGTPQPRDDDDDNEPKIAKG